MNSGLRLARNLPFGLAFFCVCGFIVENSRNLSRAAIATDYPAGEIHLIRPPALTEFGGRVQNSVKAEWKSAKQYVHNARPLKLVTVGGSATAIKPSFGDFVADAANGAHGDQTVVAFNPSQGMTGSDWAACFMDTLVPSDVDVLVWEFAINDWRPESVTLPKREWHQSVFALFLARALHLYPGVTIGIVFLWQPAAARCWPSCPDDRMLWNDVLPVLQHYQSKADIFAIDFNHIAKRTHTKETLFRDLHHPTETVHREIGELVLKHVERRLHGRSSDITTLSMEALLPRAWAQNELIRSIMDAESNLVMRPHLESKVKLHALHAAVDKGKHSKGRIDTKWHLPLPECGSKEGGVVYRTTKPFKFVGLNINFGHAVGKMIKPDLIRIAVGSHVLQPAATPSFLSRGFAAPQQWYQVVPGLFMWSVEGSAVTVCAQMSGLSTYGLLFA
jgi:hypothetical protein